MAEIEIGKFTLESLTTGMYGFTMNAAKTYFVASLYTVIPQLVCTFATVLIIFPGLLRVLK